MKRVAYISIIFLFTFLTGFTESYAVSADDVDACRKLLEAGQKLMSENRCADALNCFRPLAELYDKTASHRQKLTCLYGIYGCVEASFYLGDYGAAFDYLLMADQITSADNLPVARLHSNYTMLYIVLASQNGKDALYRNALDHALLGFRLSLRENDTIASYRTFCDMASAAYVLNDFSRISNVEKQMRRLAASGHWRYKVALLQLKARKETVGKNFRAAVSAYDSILRVLPAETGNIRMYASVIKDRALSLGYAGYPAAAVQSLSEVERVSYLYNMKDLRFTSYNVRRRLYEMMPGQESEAAEMRRKATAIKDSLQSYMILGDMVQLEFIKERRDLQRKLAISDLKHDILLWGCIGLFVVLLVVISLLMLLRSKNRRLRRSALLLHDRMRKLYDAGEKPAPDDSHKYEGSRLTEKDKEEIAEAIRKVMNSDVIYSPEMSLNGLSEIVGRHPKAVSQSLHEKFGCNFSTLINKARIIEACRRLDSPEYENWVAEAIGESVGYNSRTAFITNFKKFTGLGIREYRHASRASDPD